MAVTRNLNWLRCRSSSRIASRISHVGLPLTSLSGNDDWGVDIRGTEIARLQQVGPVSAARLIEP